VPWRVLPLFLSVSKHTSESGFNNLFQPSSSKKMVGLKILVWTVAMISTNNFSAQVFKTMHSHIESRQKVEKNRFCSEQEMLFKFE
jgi:hypothetical protein